MADPVRVLYLDDDAGLGVLLSRALVPHGCVVEAVVTGDEALARLREARFDVMALDHNLGHETGLDVIPRVQALENAPPIIYVTGSDDVRVAVAALKAGAVDYVWKDVAGLYRELLRQAIETAVQQEKIKREREEAQRQVIEARDRAEALLKEVNHRVANSLAIVSSLVQMQANAVADPSAKEMLQDTRARIAAIAGVHKRLYTSSDVNMVELNAYLKSLVEEIGASLTLNYVRLKFLPSAHEVSIATDKIVSLGVVITELLTNAAKYAYKPDQGGEIRVRVVNLADRTVAVSVEDDGVGWRGAGPAQGSGLGMRIIRAMTQSLQSELTYGEGPGTQAQLHLRY